MTMCNEYFMCIFSETFNLLLQNELCRMGMNVSVLDELVHEYCIYRGFVDFSVASPSGKSFFIFLNFS